MRIKLLPFVSVVVSLLILVKLGLWQVERYYEKLDLEQTYTINSVSTVTQSQIHDSASSLSYKNIELTGKWLPEDSFFLNLKKHKGVIGMQVIMPLLLSSGAKVLVNRGWIKHNPDDKNNPLIYTPEKNVSISGMIRKMSNSYFMSNSPNSKRKMFVDIDALTASDRSLAKVVVFQTSNNVNDGLIRKWQVPSFKPMMHLGYAIMWFSFALILLLGALYMQFKEKGR